MGVVQILGNLRHRTGRGELLEDLVKAAPTGGRRRVERDQVHALVLVEELALKLALVVDDRVRRRRAVGSEQAGNFTSELVEVCCGMGRERVRGRFGRMRRERTDLLRGRGIHASENEKPMYSTVKEENADLMNVQ